jgi:DNA-binding MarR family transcriptional regulator
MARWTSIRARRSAFIPVMRELARCYQAFERFDARLHRERGLTTPQADVLFTLGNTAGLTCKELGEKTLITKGTLTGVLDRMEAKSLVKRRPSSEDGRSYIVTLTRKGEEMFEDIYPKHIRILHKRFGKLSETELERTRSSLARLRAAFE